MGAVAILLLFSLGTANASNGSSTLHRDDSRGTIFLTQKVGGSGVLVSNNTPFTMKCWVDGPWTSFHGNYSTNRYFKGVAYTSKGAITGYVTASVVIHQTKVGHC